jgi:small subunit ribosomal protein S8
MVDVLADALNKIKVCEARGKYECDVASTKLIASVLDTMKKNSYVSDFAEFNDGKFKKIRVTLSKKINDIGVIKPRYAVGIADYQLYETRYIPSKDFGILVVSTSKGIMTNREAKQERLGGRLIAYIY